MSSEASTWPAITWSPTCTPTVCTVPLWPKSRPTSCFGARLPAPTTVAEILPNCAVTVGRLAAEALARGATK